MEKKRNPINYFRGVSREMKRVRWPSKEVFLSSIGVVLCITIFASLILAVEDLAGSTLVEQLRNAFESLRG